MEGEQGRTKGEMATGSTMGRAHVCVCVSVTCVLPSESAARVGVKRVGVAGREVVRWEVVGVGGAMVVTDTFSTGGMETRAHGNGNTQTHTWTHTNT